jgi:hypothetical protein
VAVTAAISPYRSVRDEVRAKIDSFVEVFVDTPIEVCEERDVKGLYERARAGEIPEFTGVSDPYEPPATPEVRVVTHDRDASASAAQVIEYPRASAHGAGAAGRSGGSVVIDLHSHSTMSDGTDSPARSSARRRGRASALALTDHDTPTTCRRRAAAGNSLRLVPAARFLRAAGRFPDDAPTRVLCR